jgi:UDP-N-acetylmuramoyl-L-alanyl-D-glutamate--2,6-diaminopimelate ligase
MPGKVGKNAMKAVKNFTGLASDSREVKPGFLFAALPGIRTDGARYVKDAVDRGATVILGQPDLASAARALGVDFIEDVNPRRALAKLAAAFYGSQPKTVAAVTGTNGKSSVTVFLREIWSALDKPAASIGTVGVVTPWGEAPLAHTTPDPIETHRLLAELKQRGVDHLAIEASSHGLDQRRLDGVEIAAAAFTNVTRDHLDYHQTFEAYLNVKLRLFREVVCKAGLAVINADAEHAETFHEVAEHRGLHVLTVGRSGETLRLAASEPHSEGQKLSLEYAGRHFELDLPLVGLFQASNALVAAGLAIGLGERSDDVFAALSHLRGAPGRLEKVAYARCGAPVYVDYAHTPDAIETVLKAVRPHATGRLFIVFGCGGDRDAGKRRLMGAAAARFADRIIVTDDNPRSEDAASIRKAILAGSPEAREVGDRSTAIREAVAELGEGDALVIAGKGHETGQIVGTRSLPFSDREEAVNAAIAQGGRSTERRP